MGALYYLSFRDVANPGTGVTAGEAYRLEVDAGADWTALTLTGGEWVPWDQVSGVFAGKRVCFVVHGFNVPLVAGVRSLGPPAAAFEALAGPPLAMPGADLVVPVVWPGDGFILWSYFTAFAHAATVGARFSDFLRSSAFSAASVSFISHSLGARVVLETVRQTLAASGGAPRVPFETAVLMAAAVDDDALDTPAFAPVAGPGGLRRIVVLSSMTDTVLSGDFPLGDVVDGVLFAGYAADARAMGRFGPAFQDGAPAAAKTEWYAIAGQQDHGDYLPAGGAPPTQGWTDKPQTVGLFCRDVIDAARFAEPRLQGWAQDNTGRFRAGWVPRL
jgi:hypothetical protein